MFGMLLKAKRLKEEQKAEADAQEAALAQQNAGGEEEEKQGEPEKFNPNVKYSPKR